MIIGPLILILVVIMVADFCVMLCSIRARMYGRIKNPFLAFTIALVTAVSIVYCMISAVTVLLNTIGLDGLK